MGHFNWAVPIVHASHALRLAVLMKTLDANKHHMLGMDGRITLPPVALEGSGGT